MRLTSIKLAGFKSFVDPTTMVLDASLTGIVGPNGCGKSNVIDAVRWVTGESSARQLRGEALEDVIFNGARGRKPVGRAAVELRFDNHEGKAGGQYARFTEIAIRREHTREGGSSYFINGTKARRRDVVDLFLGTGLGGRSNYAVIEQGAVNRLVEAKPADLRQVLEETAGISRYKERRRETENRIRHTRDNLDRLNDLIGEVTQRLEVLKRQARNAESYKRLKQDERRLRAELLALRWRAFDAEVQAARDKQRQCEQALAQAVSTQRQAQAQRDKHNQAQQTAAATCQQQQTAFYDAQAHATHIAQALEHARQLQQVQQREHDDLAHRLAQLQARAAEDQDTLRQLEQASDSAATELTQRVQQRDAARQQLQAADAAIEQAEQQWAAFTGKDTPQARLQAEHTQREYLLQRLQRSQATYDKRSAEAQALTAADDDQALQTLTTQVQTLTIQVADDEQRLQAEAKALAALHDDKQHKAAASDATRSELAELQARLAAEKAMQQGVLREDDASLREWLAAQGYTDVHSVARQVDAPPEWQTAVEAALAEWLSGFAVARLPQAEAAMQWPANSLTLVACDDCEVSAGDHEVAGLPSLASRLNAPAAIRAVAARYFVAENLAAALAARDALAAGQLIVTRDGACIGPGTLRTPAGQQATQGVLERERRIKTLTAESKKAAEQLQTLQADVDTLARQHQRAQADHKTREQSLSAARKQLAQRQAEQHGLRERRQQQRRRSEELAREQQQLAQQLDQDHAELAALDARIATLQTQAETHARQRETAEHALSQARQTRNDVRGQLDTAESRVHALQQEQAAAHSRRDSLHTRLAETRTARAQVDERLQQMADEAQETAIEQGPSEADHAEAKAQQQAAETALREARAQLKQAEQNVASAAQAAMQADTAVATAREAMQQAQIAVETASARRDGLVEQLDELQAQAETLLADLETTATAEQWQGKIATVERRIARLGAINLAAIEEHDQEAEREQYLQAQHDDLSAALATLENAIATIDRETRSRFKDTFTQVNQRFGSMFPTLFGGGQAALELTEDDLLSAGVRVMARPPGKRNASIQMLSGGEKALTAMALLFALFELNPAPFCMLDEIDAPLDDANVSRFCDLVRQMSAHIQFIVITHNKLTMELAEQLHGVTMAEPGVSRLVSVNMDQALDMAG